MVLYVEIDPSDYHVLHPRPVYLIVSRSRDGVLNVMAASWVSPVNDEPFVIAAPIWMGSKTYKNIHDTKEFTVNVVNDEYVDIVWAAGTLSGKKIDKWGKLGLKPVSSSKINVPGIEGVLGFLECRVRDEIVVGETALFLADVLAIHVNKEYYEKYGWNLRKTNILLHAGGKAFVTTGKLVFPSRSMK